jgi:hypothetical protein
MRLASLVLVSLLLAACGDDAPEHYYVLCEDKDGAGWNLVDYGHDEKGYLMACTYQSPDRQQAYTARCTDAGCD